MGLAQVKKFGYGQDGKTLELTISIPKDSYLTEFWVANQNDIQANNSTKVGIEFIAAVQKVDGKDKVSAFNRLFTKVGEFTCKENGNVYYLYNLNQDCPWLSDSKGCIGIHVSQNDLNFITMVVMADNSEINFPDKCKCGADDVTTVFPLYNLLAIKLRALSFAQFMKDSCIIPADFIDKILQIKAIELAVLSCDYYRASTFWNKFYKGKNIVTNKRCGCHG